MFCHILSAFNFILIQQDIFYICWKQIYAKTILVSFAQHNSLLIKLKICELENIFDLNSLFCSWPTFRLEF